MKTIWKYILETTDRQTISVPTEFDFLTVQMQGGKPCLWVMVNPQSNTRECVIDIIGTGHMMTNDPRKYIGTYQLHEGQLVFHVFQNLV